MRDLAATPCRTALVSDVLSLAAKAAFNSNTNSECWCDSEFRQTALKKGGLPGVGVLKKSVSSPARIRDHVECDGEARLFAMEWQRAVPEIRREQHQLANLGLKRKLGL